MMELHQDYEKFITEQTHVKASTLGLLRSRLRGFPEPSKLNGAYFKVRMKKVAPATVDHEVKLARRFFKWLDQDAPSLSKEKLKLPKIEESITVEDLYTEEELNAILSSCIHTRDRAMFEVLYESASRANELLTMTIENTTFNEDGTATVIVTGKTGTRKIPLYESVPALKSWLDVHPIGKKHIWVKLRRPHTSITARQLYNVTKLAIERAKIKRNKKRIVHLFRHTRATELVRRGVRGQVLSKLMGWTKKSNMEAVYIHLSTEDVTNEIHAKVFGLDTKEDTRKPLLESTTCPRCDTKNAQNARICSKCSMPLSNDAIMDAVQQQERKREELDHLIQERVDEAMQGVVQSLKSTKALKDMAIALAKEMKKESG